MVHRPLRGKPRSDARQCVTGHEAQLRHEMGSSNIKIGDLGFEGFSLAFGVSR